MRSARPLGVLLALTAGLWTVDVLVHLGLARLAFRPEDLVGAPLDFLTLFVLELQIAVPAFVAGLAVAAVRRRLRPGSGAGRPVAVLAGILTLVTVPAGARIAWNQGGGGLATAAGIGLIAGIVAWAAVGRVLRRRESVGWTGSAAWIVLPALVIGFGSRAVAEKSLVDALAAGGSLLLALILARRRRPVLEAVPLLAAVAAAGVLCVRSASLGGGAPAPAATSDRPDVYLIVLDTVRADRLQRYGHARNTMPRLEDWAGGAAVFRHATSPAGWTTPAHASMFSGLGVSQHGVHYALKAAFKTPPFPGISWLPEQLAGRGYHPVAVTANPLSVEWPLPGFERTVAPSRREWYDSTLAALVDHFSPLSARLSERTRWRLPYVTAPRIVDAALRVFSSSPRPVFGFVNLLDAHGPYNPPESALRELGLDPDRPLGRYRSSREWNERLAGLPPGSLQVLHDLYDAELRGMDPALGRLLDWIENRSGPDAVVIVTSDHGEELGEGGRVGHEYGVSQALIHVPLMIRAPRLSPGERDALVSLQDLHALILGIADGRDGEALAAFSREDSARTVVSERYGSLHNAQRAGPEYALPWISMIHDGTKIVGPPDERFEVLDVRTEGFAREIPMPLPANADSLRESLGEYWDRHRDRREEEGEDFHPSSDEEMEKLRALGYVE